MVPELTHCFNTKKRAPIKIVMETINLTESADWDDKIVKKEEQEESCPSGILEEEKKDENLINSAPFLNQLQNKLKKQTKSKSKSPLKGDTMEPNDKDEKHITSSKSLKSLKISNHWQNQLKKKKN